MYFFCDYMGRICHKIYFPIITTLKVLIYHLDEHEYYVLPNRHPCNLHVSMLHKHFKDHCRSIVAPFLSPSFLQVVIDKFIFFLVIGFKNINKKSFSSFKCWLILKTIKIFLIIVDFVIKILHILDK